MSDGSYQVEVYAYPVHELVDGVWVEIESAGQNNVLSDVSPGSAQTNILDNFVWEDHGVQSSTGLRLYIGSRSGYTARTYIQFATMPTIPAGSTITAATMKLTMVSGTSLAYTANAYQVTGGEWDPTTIQWTNKPAANVLLESNISNNDRTKYQFSVLTAVRHWYDGDPTGQNENYGIMLRYYDETLTGYYNSVYSGDVVDTNSRPKLTISYTPPSNEVSMLVGKTRTLTVSDYTGTITWTSSDPSVATVSSSGVVTSVKVGATTVTAYGDGNELKVFNVYVTIGEGVYYIRNSGGSYLGTSGQSANGTKTYLFEKATSGRAQLNQLWRIDYLGRGYYSIRPLYNMNMALCSEGGVPGSVVITTIGDTDAYNSVPAVNRWSINSSTAGMELYCAGTSYMTLCCEQLYPGAAVVTKNGSENPSGRYWSLESAPDISPQLLLMDVQTGASVVGTKKYIDPGQTVTLEDLGITAAFVYLYSTNQDVVLSAPGSTDVSIDSTYETITGSTPGAEATITVRHILNGTSYDATFTICVKPIIDGAFFVQGRAYNRYMQIDNNDESNGFTTSGAIMEQWEFDGGDYQKWLFQWRGNGYYSIISAESGMALTVPSGETESIDISLVQEPYTGSDCQKWKITLTDDHYYKIKAKSSESASDDLVMAVGYSLVNNSNGVNIEQRKYVDDANYKDEWLLSKIGEYECKLLGLNENNIPRNDYFESVTSIVENKLNYNVYTNFYTEISKSEVKRLLADSDIFIIHTHGQKEGIYVSSTDYLSMDDIEDTNLSGLGFALLLTCNTATDFSIDHISNKQPVNIVEQMVCCGAETVIGFSTITTVSDCNRFAPAFIEQTVEYGRTVREAMYSINYYGYDIDMSSSSRIGGNDEKCLND